jgi:hypothetical protein
LTRNSVIVAGLPYFLLQEYKLTAVVVLGNGDMKGKQPILIVDDEQDITFVLEMMLNDRYDVDVYTALSRRSPMSGRTSTT